MKKISRFWDRHAKGYAKSPVADEASYQKKLEQTRDFMTTDMEVLEVGCGTGSTAITQCPNVRHIHAVDVSEGMLEIAQEKTKAAGIENISYEQAMFEEIDVGDKRYDMVMAHSLIHLLEDRDEALRRIKSFLKPGGLFVSSTVCIQGKMAWLRFIIPIAKVFSLLPMVKFFSVADYIASVEQAGFEIEVQWQPPSGQSVFVIARKKA
ncbi:class I SAM-dependent methyltransferase [Terasakiella sp. A23]|uniref:class I SAM-dependent methyltransferase n=1 Tax=Terasakiella sp. FCG-A23 TaxID=3080561 RepID=UPI002953CDDF|nr:class I SAM-dependent methyltransferase [Terasakiella sp. A23]MDV7338925.1 class I SAM-dependent methyltransferase [Terasakiella sp. A23]